METSEATLHRRLRADPDDWSARLELVDQLAGRGESAEAGALIEEARSAPPNEEVLRRAIERLDGIRSGALGFLAPFVEAHPSEPLGHWALACALHHAGDPGRARAHYDTAVSLDGDYRTEEVERALAAAERNSAAGTPETHPAATEDEFPVAAVAPESAAVLVSEVDADPVQRDGVADDSERELAAGEGETVEAAEKEPETASKITALLTAILVHLGLVVVLGTVAVTVPSTPPPQVIARTDDPEKQKEVPSKEMEKPKRAAAQSASSRMQVVAPAAVSSLAAPRFDSTELSTEPIGAGNDFGTSLSLGGGEGEGMVSFFGTKSKAKKVVFVVDASASMRSTGGGSKTKFELMKEELIKTIKALPPTVEFQIIFFSGPAWFAGEGEDRDDWHQWEVNGRTSNFWHYEDGDPENLPREDYEQATRGAVRRAIDDIEDTEMSFGTDWRSPLKMAMNLEPDLIYFMTDGAVGKHPDKPPVVEDVLDYNRVKSLAKINTICLMELRAFEMLKELADKSRGEFTLVLEDGTSLRGEEVEKMAQKR